MPIAFGLSWWEEEEEEEGGRECWFGVVYLVTWRRAGLSSDISANLNFTASIGWRFHRAALPSAPEPIRAHNRKSNIHIFILDISFWKKYIYIYNIFGFWNEGKGCGDDLLAGMKKLLFVIVCHTWWMSGGNNSHWGKWFIELNQLYIGTQRVVTKIRYVTRFRTPGMGKVILWYHDVLHLTGRFWLDECNWFVCNAALKLKLPPATV